MQIIYQSELVLLQTGQLSLIFLTTLKRLQIQLKLSLIPLTSNANRVELPDQQKFKILNNDQEYFTILGYSMDNRGNPNKTLWSKMMKKIKNKIEELSRRNLSFKGKILATKTLLLSKF